MRPAPSFRAPALARIVGIAVIILFCLCDAASAVAAAATAAPSDSTSTSSAPLLTLILPLTQSLPNPQALPARTFATLSSAGYRSRTYLTRSSSFIFQDIPAGSYLCEVWSHGHLFMPMRVDVNVSTDTSHAAAEHHTVEVWQTFRGNEWNNKGERLGGGPAPVHVIVGVQGERLFYEQRPKFSPMALLANPMMLLSVVAMVVLVGMPKMMENMDPEIREEFEKRQREGPLGSGANPMAGFDMAAWMAGSNPSNARSESPATKSRDGGGATGVRKRQR